MRMRKVILASASPRRLEILQGHGIDPVVLPSEADETLPPEVEAAGPEEVVRYLAQIKARSIYEKLREQGAPDTLQPGAVILGADTIVYKDRIIGKPLDAEDAFAILASLRASSHHVLTGVCLIDAYTGGETTIVDDTRVTFHDYPDEEIRRFIREEPPYDKSGSYAIQSSWSGNVAAVEGDIENVIGLPYQAIAPYLE
jgi:septum formation protein